jgi:hypothetical protein
MGFDDEVLGPILGFESEMILPRRLNQVGGTHVDSLVHCRYGFIEKDSWNLEPRFFFFFLGGACRLHSFRLMSSQQRIHPAFVISLLNFVEQ